MPPRKEDFLRDISNALSLLNPTAETDSAQASATAYTAILRGAELWLSPLLVEQFHPDDFSDLAADERQTLSSAVAAFRTVTATVPNRGPATREQSNAARNHLNVIYVILKPTLDALRNPIGNA